MRASARLDHGTDAFVGEYFEQQRVLDAAVDDMRASDPILHRVERRADLGKHATVNRPVGEQRFDLAGGEPSQESSGAIEYSRRVGHQNQLLRVERLGELAGDQISVDVVGDPVGADAYRSDHGDEITRVEQIDEFRIDPLDLADEADVDEFLVVGLVLDQELAGVDERPVLPGQAYGAPALLIDESDDFLVKLAQHHLDDVHYLIVGHSHALLEFAGDAHLLQQVPDLRATPVNDHRIHTDELEHHDVPGEPGLEMRLGHGVATVLDDDRPVVETLDVGQGFGEDLRLEGGGAGLDRHGVHQGPVGGCADCTRTHADAISTPLRLQVSPDWRRRAKVCRR